MFIFVLDFFDVTETAPWMLSVVCVDLGPQTHLELFEIPAIEAGNGLEVFQKLNAPVARVVLGLIFDVVAPLTVPCAHSNVWRDDLDGGGDVKVGG